MREIKFRAWDKKTKSLSQVNNRLDFTFNGDLIGRAKFIFMQYTGLKDKNGVEIYEGDIVYLSGIGLTEIEFPFIDLYQACYENDIGAIIGNIYENPELLKED